MPRGRGVLLVLLALLPAMAASANTGPASWAIVSIPNGGPVETIIRFDAVGDFGLLWSWYDAEWTWLGTTVYVRNGHDGQLAFSHEDVHEEVRLDDADPRSGTVTISSTLPTGAWYRVVVAAGALREWSYDVQAAGASPYRAGERVFFSNGSDFTEGSEARLHARDARVIAGAARQYTFQIEGAFFGSIGATSPPSSPTHEITTLSGPGGTHSCPCAFGALAGAASIGPGEWMIERTAAEARVLLLAPHSVVIGADITPK